nr:PREDICTED: uncharacterized protein LOC108227262 [Daucus carota subsp. sativus]
MKIPISESPILLRPVAFHLLKVGKKRNKRSEGVRIGWFQEACNGITLKCWFLGQVKHEKEAGDQLWWMKCEYITRSVGHSSSRVTSPDGVLAGVVCQFSDILLCLLLLSSHN